MVMLKLSLGTAEPRCGALLGIAGSCREPTTSLCFCGATGSTWFVWEACGL